MRKFLIYAFPLYLCSAVALSADAQPFILKGTVRGADSLPIPSASVSVLDLHKGTITDSSGFFSVEISEGSLVAFSAVGYADTTVRAGAAHEIMVWLKRRPTSLRNVVIRGSSKSISIPANGISPEQKMAREIKGRMERQLEPGSDYSVVPQTIIQAGSIQMPGIGQAGASINHGTTVVAFSDKEETRGSRYLLNHSCHGVVIGNESQVINDSNVLYNYNKLTGRLMLTRDGKQYVEVDPKQMNAFAFQDDDTCFIFMKVPIIDTENFYALLALGSEYGIFRSISTHFVRSDFFNSGLIERGNNYDEYVDKIDYFIVDYRNRKAAKFGLDKKSLLRCMPGLRPLLERFLKEHRHEILNDELLQNLIEYLNNLPGKGDIFASRRGLEYNVSFNL